MCIDSTSATQPTYDDNTIVFYNHHTTFKTVVSQPPLRSYHLLRRKIANAKTATLYRSVSLIRSSEKIASLDIDLDVEFERLPDGRWIGAKLLNEEVELFEEVGEEEDLCVKVEHNVSESSSRILNGAEHK